MINTQKHIFINTFWKFTTHKNINKNSVISDKERELLQPVSGKDVSTTTVLIFLKNKYENSIKEIIRAPTVIFHNSGFCSNPLRLQTFFLFERSITVSYTISI